MTRAEVVELLRVLADNYPTWAERLSETLPDTWAVVLGDLPAERVAAAAVQHLQNSHFPPTAADLRKRAAPRSDSVAEEAWTLCLRAASMVGPYASPDRFAELWRALRAKDALAAATLEVLGGFRLLHTQTADDAPHNRARFERIHATLVDRRRRESDESLAIETLRRGGFQLGSGDRAGPRRIGA